jgi:hypothetical protein
MQRIVRKVWRELFSVNEFDDFTSYIPANEKDVELCNSGVGNGPGDSDVRLDFNKGYASSRWNKLILHRILNIVTTRSQENGLMLPKVSEAYLMGLLEGQLKRSQGAWAQHQPRLQLETLEWESPAKREERVKDQHQRRLVEVGARALRKRVSSYSVY